MNKSLNKISVNTKMQTIVKKKKLFKAAVNKGLKVRPSQSLTEPKKKTITINLIEEEMLENLLTEEEIKRTAITRVNSLKKVNIENEAVKNDQKPREKDLMITSDKMLEPSS